MLKKCLQTVRTIHTTYGCTQWTKCADEFRPSGPLDRDRCIVLILGAVVLGLEAVLELPLVYTNSQLLQETQESCPDIKNVS